jgi:ATP-dependent RNA helicase RhlE
MKFADLGLSPGLLKSLEASGYETATPIQAQAIPPILAGRDVLGSAQTGTGKTAAFALPALQRVAQLKKESGTNKSAIRCLVLVPTRELALQVSTSFNKYGRSGLGGEQGVGAPLRFAVVFGGVSQHRQVDAIRSGVDVLVATPGRLLDLHGQSRLDLSQVSIFILDEADQMMDMGFIVPIRKIAGLVAKAPPAGNRQTLMFSATMPREIKQLATEMLHDYVEVSVAPSGTAAELVSQSAYLVPRTLKGALLRHYLTEHPAWKALVFTRTKHGADRVARGLLKSGIKAAAIHGNRTQPQRTRALEAFKKGEIAVLVATDVAARGLHISEVSHVINFDMPEVPETYVHRIGRTGRAGAEGTATSFVDPEDRGKLRAIERLIRRSVEIVPIPEALESDEPHQGEESRRPDPRGAQHASRPASQHGSQPAPQHASQRAAQHASQRAAQHASQRSAQHAESTPQKRPQDGQQRTHHAHPPAGALHRRPNHEGRGSDAGQRRHQTSSHPKAQGNPQPKRPSGPGTHQPAHPTGGHPLQSRKSAPHRGQQKRRSFNRSRNGQ